MSITIWHNPRCGKSREALKLLEEKGHGVTIYKYLEEKPSVAEIKEVLKLLGISPRELMRTKEEIYKELKLKDVSDDEALIQAMSEHQKLIERPIVVRDFKAVIGRPPSLIVDFLEQ